MNASALLPLLTKYGGSSISYSTLEPGLKHWFVANVGYAAYTSSLGHKFVLGCPVCHDESLGVITSDLVNNLNRPAFVQIDEAFAELLHAKFGYKITQIGVETSLDIQKYSLTDDSRKSRLRASLRKGRLTSNVHELTSAELSDRFRIGRINLDELSRKWLAGKTKRKYLRFLIRTISYDDQPFVRKFYSIGRDNQLQGFAFFTPIFEEDNTVGYCCDAVRTGPDAPYGHAAYLILSALDHFRQEGLRTLSLGLSPVVSRDAEFRPDFLTTQALKYLYRYGNGLFNFSGIYRYKKQFGGERKPAFMATGRTFTGIESLALARLMRFV
ncbi:MAG: phosphatidylglycerol lysyltransferase domain-containing protein [Terriglobia bacterium]